jgi:hypothetical protein
MELSPHQVVKRAPFNDHGGWSGATLERAELRDGTPIVLKTSSPRTDLFLRLLGDSRSREYSLWRQGVMNELPPPVGHAILGGWTSPDGDVTIVMRDIGTKMLGWSTKWTRSGARRMLRAIHGLHQHFHESPPAELTSLSAAVGAFSPSRIESANGSSNPLFERVCRGWDAFETLLDHSVARDVLSLLADPEPLAAALQDNASTMCHGDFAAVNMAWEGSRLTLIDWGQTVAAPGAYDIARFLPSGLAQSDISLADFLNEYRRIAGPAFEHRAMNLALLSAFVSFGWTIALSSVDSLDQGSASEPTLAWWVAQARAGLALM